MASRAQIEEIYNPLDELFRATLGENADFSCAMYNGDYSLTLEEAQQAVERLYARWQELEARRGP